MKDNTVLITIIYILLLMGNHVIHDNMPAVFINRGLLQLSMLTSDVTRPLRTKQLSPVSDVTHVTSRTPVE